MAMDVVARAISVIAAAAGLVACLCILLYQPGIGNTTISSVGAGEMSNLHRDVREILIQLHGNACNGNPNPMARNGTQWHEGVAGVEGEKDKEGRESRGTGHEAASEVEELKKALDAVKQIAGVTSSNHSGSNHSTGTSSSVAGGSSSHYDDSTLLDMLRSLKNASAEAEALVKENARLNGMLITKAKSTNAPTGSPTASTTVPVVQKPADGLDQGPALTGACPTERFLHPPGAPYYSFPPPTDATLHRTVNLPVEIVTRFMAIQKKIVNCDEPVTVLVAGGSMTGGGRCSQPKFGTNKLCAWPHRVELWLHSVFTPKCIQVINVARGGTQSEVAVSSLPLQLRTLQRPPDIIMTDYTVNDVCEFDGNVGHTTAIKADTYEKSAAIGEGLMKVIKQTCPNAVHMMVFSHFPGGIENPIVDGMRDAASHRGVPFFDLRKLLPEYDLRSKQQATSLWEAQADDTKRAHPSFKAHQVVADVVVFGLRKAFFPDCVKGDQFGQQSLLSQLPMCVKPVTERSAFLEYKSDKQSKLSGKWDLTEDRIGKPGWIATVDKSVLTIPLKFGAVPTLMVTYLRSYKGMGNAILKLNGIELKLRGMWKKKMSTSSTFYSQAYATTIQTRDPSDDNHFGIIGFSVKPHSQHDLTLTFQTQGANSKFKLIEVFTC